MRNSGNAQMIRRSIYWWLALWILSITLAAAELPAAELHVAVATNFVGTVRSLAPLYEAETGTKLVISSGATGALYNQIRHGAPFDVFLAADSRRPQALAERDGLALPDSRFTYAEGKLVLWSPQEDLVDETGAVLSSGGFRHLAVANPRTAPYGAAALQVLEAMGLASTLAPRMVRSENIGQAFQWVRSGTAELGFVALAQVIDEDGNISGSYWLPPQEQYDPIAQQAVIINRSEHVPAARHFLNWLRSPTTTQIIQTAGYETPDAY